MTKSDHVNHKNRLWHKMVARNGKIMMKLVRLPILRPQLLKRSVRFYVSLKTQKFLRICMAGCQFFKIFEFSNYHKIERLSNSGIKIDNLNTDFIILFPFLATILYHHLFL